MDFDKLSQLGGWENRPALAEKVCGASTSFRGNLYDANPTLKGGGKGKTVLLFQAFKAVPALGKDPIYRAQTMGSCVGRTGAMVADDLAAMQSAAGESVWPGHTLAASVYGPARVEIGHDIHGDRVGGDGAVVAYAVESVTKFGMLHAKKYAIGSNRWDFTGQGDDDALCAEWGRSGMPDALEPTARTRVFREWAVVQNYEEARDAVAGGCPVYFGTSQSFWGRTRTRNANGYLRAIGKTAHSWHVAGCIDDGAIVALVLDNRNWGDDWCDGPEGPYPIGRGRFLCTPDDFNKLVDAGEAYAVSHYAGLDVPPNVVPDFTKW